MSLYNIDLGVFAKDPIVSVPTKKIPSPSLSSPLIPPAPSAIADLINHVRLCASGQSSAEGLLVFKLAAGDFEYLKEILHQDINLQGFFYNKIRYDYNYSSYIFTARMPGHAHEYVLSRITDSFTRQLIKLEEDKDNYVAQAAKKIEYVASWRCKWEGQYGLEKHDPDAAWRCKGILVPHVILEISYSQPTKDLESLAKFYIVGSGGKVKKVIGIDISYGQGKKGAILSVWEPKQILRGNKTTLICHKVIDSVIRDQLGNAIQDPKNVLGLRLMLKDFGNISLFEKFSTLTQTIKISLADLYMYLHETECVIELEKEAAKAAYILDEGRGDKDFGRSPSIETLLPQDEKAFEESEKREKKRYKKEDKSYRSQKTKNGMAVSRDKLARRPFPNQVKSAKSTKIKAAKQNNAPKRVLGNDSIDEEELLGEENLLGKEDEGHNDDGVSDDGGGVGGGSE